jgi:hypothetical protein
MALIGFSHFQIRNLRRVELRNGAVKSGRYGYENFYAMEG